MLYGQCRIYLLLLKYHKTVGQVMVEVARRLAIDLLVPFVVTDFSHKLVQLIKLLEDDYGQLLSKHNIKMSKLFIILIYKFL